MNGVELKFSACLVVFPGAGKRPATILNCGDHPYNYPAEDAVCIILSRVIPESHPHNVKIAGCRARRASRKFGIA